MAFLAFGVLLCAFLVYQLERCLIRKRLPFPPGPPGYPLVGHTFSIPTVDQDAVFYEWGKLYGKLIDTSDMKRF
jgi:hypothetical protein